MIRKRDISYTYPFLLYSREVIVVLDELWGTTNKQQGLIHIQSTYSKSFKYCMEIIRMKISQDLRIPVRLMTFMAE